MRFIIYVSLLLGSAALIFSGCKKDEQIIPNVSFSATVNLTDPAYTGNPFIVKVDMSRKRVGINGVVVYRMSASEYYVFDLMCPHNKLLSCLVEIEDGASCRCPCCDSRFLVVTSQGGVIEGPSAWGLKPYNNQVVGDYMNIWN